MDIKLISFNNWEGFYIDDELVLEGQSISANEMLKNLLTRDNVIATIFTTISVYDTKEEISNLPKNFYDIGEKIKNKKNTCEYLSNVYQK